MGAWIKIVDMQYPFFYVASLVVCGLKQVIEKTPEKNVALNNIKTHHKGMEEI